MGDAPFEEVKSRTEKRQTPFLTIEHLQIPQVITIKDIADPPNTKVENAKALPDKNVMLTLHKRPVATRELAAFCTERFRQEVY